MGAVRCLDYEWIFRVCVCVIECVNALRMFFNFRLVIYRNIII